MKKENEDKLKAAFPQFFIDLHTTTPQQSCMSWGIECGDGWYDLIYSLCGQLLAQDPYEEFKASQVKEKFGGLRFYVDCSTPEINRLIDVAEELSYKVCETCGSNEKVSISGLNWVKTLCKKCSDATYSTEK